MDPPATLPPPQDAAQSQPQDSTPVDAGSAGKHEVPQLPRNIYAVRNGGEYERKNRSIIICLDGTGDQFDDDNSNIVHLVSCLKKADPTQLTYYQSGIGTYDGGGMTNGVNAALDMAVGSGLGVHVRDAYKFLMQNYHQGDKISLFGFSRGAYTARCLAGMVHKVGVLPAHNVAQIPFAYRYYKDDSVKGWKMSEDFKRTFCKDVNIHFIGVFDSVASVGFIPRKLPLSATPKNRAAHFRHAMALDERRAKFKACRFRRKDEIYDDKWAVVAEKEPDLNGANGATNGNYINVVQDDPNGQQSDGTSVLEVWFAGCHCDVGGGAVPNEQRHKLSQIPLRWMIRQCFECDTGIIFKTHRLADEGIDVQTLFPTYTSMPIPTSGVPSTLRERFEKGTIPPITERSSLLSPVDAHDLQGSYELHTMKNNNEDLADAWVPEQVEDYLDAVQPIKDQLELARTWWILEVTPIKVRVQPKNSDVWVKKIRPNLGRYRPVQGQRPVLHWTVEERMRSAGYKMKARIERGAEWQIVV